MDKISIIIPVHNGEKFLKKLYKNIFSQTYKNIEIIMVENFSNDNSYSILQDIAKNDERVTVLKCSKPGTSMARKMGVEYATGEYSVFMDQDDKYYNKNAIMKMYQSIRSINVDICQFLNYKRYKFGITIKPQVSYNNRIFTKEEIISNEIGSVFESYGGGYITPTVWSKIYKTSILKSAVKNIDFPLYFAEDQFLVSSCLLCDKVKTVGVVAQAYYVWNVGIGFSASNNSGLALMKDYSISKPIIDKMLIDVGASLHVRYRLHLETLYFHLVYIKSIMVSHKKEEVIKCIKSLSDYEHIKLAKTFINSELNDDNKNEELIFLASDYTPEEYYNRFYSNVETKKSLIKRIFTKLSKRK